VHTADSHQVCTESRLSWFWTTSPSQKPDDLSFALGPKVYSMLLVRIRMTLRH
jgi:hypothetical protein